VLFVGSGVATIGANAAGDPRILEGPTLTRALGKYGLVRIIGTGADLGISYHGFRDDLNNVPADDGLRVGGAGSLNPYANGAQLPIVGSVATTDILDIVILLRAVGFYAYIKGGSFTDWTLLWVDATSTRDNLYLGSSPGDGTANYGLDRLILPTRTFIPPITVYDTFTAANGTSLDAHTSDSTGPDGATQSTDVQGSWTIQSGTIQVQSNKAQSIGAGTHVATKSAGIADVLIEDTINLAVGTVGAIVARLTDTSNYWRMFASDGGNSIGIQEINAGTPTTRATAVVAIADSTDYNAKVVAQGQNITMFLDDANRITYGSAALNEAVTEHGIRMTAANATHDTFTVNPLTSARVSAEFDGV
jgi:hypothetical protein